MADVKPNPASDIVPITHDLQVETTSGDGRAIAMTWQGTHMLYLVISATEVAGPRWVYDNDVNAAYIGQRPGPGPSRTLTPH